MREIIFDTETTGLSAREDRIIEFGGIELINRFPTGRTFHHYINPQGRAVHPDAQAVHGISEADLVGKPSFADLAAELTEFIDGAMLIAHNASFDIGFLDAEFGRIGMPRIDPAVVIDTLAMARRKHPMGPNSLDALCRRYGIDNSHRTKHGALLDSELLAEVYIELIGGKQAAFSLDAQAEETVDTNASDSSVSMARQRPRPLGSRLSATEIEAHEKLVAKIGDAAIWHQIDQKTKQ